MTPPQMPANAAHEWSTPIPMPAEMPVVPPPSPPISPPKTPPASPPNRSSIRIVVRPLRGEIVTCTVRVETRRRAAL